MENTKKVFSFTFKQMAKRKSYLITFIIFLMVSVLAVPVLVMLKGENIGDVGIRITTDIYSLKEYLNGTDSEYGAAYAIQYGYSVILLMISVFASSYIVRAIVEEKSSKLVETLLVSINSKNMILGKILAVMTLLTIKLILIVLGFYASYKITGLVVGERILRGAWMNAGIPSMIFNLGFINILLMFVSGLIAFFIFSMLAGLVAAGCSSVEEEESQVQSAMLVIMIIYFISTFLAPIHTETVQYVSSLIPLVSAFMAPINYIMGNIPLWILIVSWTINFGIAVLIYNISGNVYDSLILYRGKSLKLSRILTMNVRKERK